MDLKGMSDQLDLEAMSDQLGPYRKPEHTMDNQLGYEFIVFKLPDNYHDDGGALRAASQAFASGDYFVV